MNNLDNAIENFVGLINKIRFDRYKNSLPLLFKDEEWKKQETVRVVGGRKYIKLATEKSVVAFVNSETGDILKAASWKAPANGVRGSVFEDNGRGSLDILGNIKSAR